MRWAVAAVALTSALALAACSSGSDEPELRTGRQIYVAVCQTCHGKTGTGFVGPSLIDVAERYPDVSTQIELVTNGQANMPGFSARLTSAQIDKVVEYTRTAFSTAPTTTTTLLGPTLPPDSDE